MGFCHFVFQKVLIFVLYIGVALEHLQSLVPQKVLPQMFLGRTGHFFGPSHASQRLLQPGVIQYGVRRPKPVPLHRGRSGPARQSEKRGGEWRARRIIDT
jgi:hypothetical protein